MNGGRLVAETLKKHGVQFLFTLCGGHISPILVESKRLGIRIIDVRDEANAVFAADAVSRLTGVPGVAAVTAGPGLTNTITAVKNAQLAQSPLIVLGGASATILKGRGSLQDIDQRALMAPHVKYVAEVKKVKQLVPALEKAFKIAQEGVPGPVFVECPVDLLYDASVVRDWYGAKSDDIPVKGWKDRLMQWYIKRHVRKIFDGIENPPQPRVLPVHEMPLPKSKVRKAAAALSRANRPVMLIGSQALLRVDLVDRLVRAVESLGIPVYLSGMARGLLGKNHPLQLRHKRRDALREADLVLLAGVPCDFRLDYGRHIRASSTFISINRSKEDLYKNRTPDIPVLADPCTTLIAMADELGNLSGKWSSWLQQLKDRDASREADIDRQAQQETEYINPIQLFRQLEKQIDDNSILIVDGGDFAATAAYTLQPRGPLTWLDPGVFGTLGVGGGFALGAKLCRPDAEVWIIWGDGSAAYSLAEYDTFSRLNIPVIGVVGNDGSWAQIARDQIEILKDDIGTVLNRTDYHIVAKGYGGDGLKLDNPADIDNAIQQAKDAARKGTPFLINAWIGKTDFRKGSISI